MIGHVPSITASDYQLASGGTLPPTCALVPAMCADVRVRGLRAGPFVAIMVQRTEVERSEMTDLATIGKLPDVKSAVLGDLGGGYLDALRESDGETIAAVMGVVSSALSTVAGELGFGALRRISIAAEATAWVVSVEGNAVLTACIQPAKSLAAI